MTSPPVDATPLLSPEDEYVPVDFRNVLDASSDAILVLDAEQRLRYCNASVGRIFGYQASALIGQPLGILLPEGHRRRHATHAGSFIRSGRSERAHRPLLVSGRRADGTEVPLNVTISRMPARTDGCTIAIVREATQPPPLPLPEQERALRESDARLQRIARASRDVLYDWDVDHDVTWHGDAMERVFGHRTRDARDLTWWRARIHPEDLERTDASLARFASSGSSMWTAEYGFARTDGTYALVLHRAFCTRNQDGAIIRSCGTLMDITALRVTQAQLRKSESARQAAASRLQVVLDEMPVGYVTFDATHRVRSWNAEMTRIFGLPLHEVRGRTLEEILETHDLAATFATRLGARELVLRREGREVICSWLQTSHLPDAAAGGGSVAMVVDVTEQRSLEAQLLHAQKLESLGRLAGGVAHDFNNLLTAILGNAAFLRSSFSLDDPRQEDVEEIRLASTRAAELTQRLLAFARRQAAAPRVIDLGTTIGGIGLLLTRLLGEDIAVTHTLVETPLRVRMDPSQLEQLLINLAVNARDAMPRGGTLAICLRPASPADCAPFDAIRRSKMSYAVIEMRDSGIGISPDALGRVFEPFFTTKEVGKGTGLGLSICHGIMQQAEGAIGVKSQEGDGTTFTVLLPLTADPPFEHTVAGGTVESGRGERVLIVEDDRAVRDVFARALRDAGFRVYTAERGEDALTLVQQLHNRIDVLVSDVQLPGMSGFALADALRARGHTLQTIFVSGYPGEIANGDVEHPKHAVPVIFKPVTAEELVTKVRQELDR